MPSKCSGWMTVDGPIEPKTLQEKVNREEIRRRAGSVLDMERAINHAIEEHGQDFVDNWLQYFIDEKGLKPRYIITPETDSQGNPYKKET